MRALLICALMGLTAATFVNCGNGNFCRPHEKCVTREAGAGRKWGCAPKNATVCKYPRFSCPATHSACQFKDAKCANAAGETVAATENSKALGHAQMRAAKKAAKKQGVLRGLFDDDKTDDDGKDDDKSDDDAGGDDDSAAGPICSVFNDDLPSFCHCADVGGGARIDPAAGRLEQRVGGDHRRHALSDGRGAIGR